jgi:choline/glycine/proline betaine transport protein
MSIFGGNALWYELSGDHSISQAFHDNVATAIYKLLEKHPFVTLSSVIDILLVASFFVTSSDSGSMVVDTLTSGGRHEAPKLQKIFWASMEGMIASILLSYGGLTALQSATTITRLAITLILVVICISFVRSLRTYWEENHGGN